MRASAALRRVLTSAVAAIVSTSFAACPAPGQMDAMAQTAQTDVLALVETLLAERPFTARNVEALAGVRLRQDTGNANPYIALFLSAEPRPPLRRLELRLPRPGATRRDGLLILDLDAGVHLRQADVTARFGAGFVLEFPTAHQPADAPLYHTYRHPWGDLRFGFGRTTGLLQTVVIDAER
jgi:hypothetical protein